jgi:hypothetical protein
MKAEYRQSDSLKSIGGIQHGFFTKKGGVSSGIYASLNCGPSSEDESKNVTENRRRVMAALNMEEGKLFGLHQIHSTKVHTITKDTRTDFPQGDALVTKDQGIALSVLGADCTPVLFADKKTQIIGAAHAGWKGAVTGIIESVVSKMCDLGANRENITACIGPTIHQPSYEVREDFISQLNELSKIPAKPFLKEDAKKFYFDLPAYLLQQCQRSGISAESLGLDTYALSDEFFSYRRNTHESIKDYGRQISVIAIL